MNFCGELAVGSERGSDFDDLQGAIAFGNVGGLEVHFEVGTEDEGGLIAELSGNHTLRRNFEIEVEPCTIRAEPEREQMIEARGRRSFGSNRAVRVQNESGIGGNEGGEESEFFFGSAVAGIKDFTGLAPAIAQRAQGQIDGSNFLR